MYFLKFNKPVLIFKTFLVLVLSFILPSIVCEKILFVAFFASKSHQLTFLPLLEELSSRGHEITLVSSQLTLKVSNITHIFTYDFQKTVDERHDFFQLKESQKQYNPFLMAKEYTEACSLIYDKPEIKSLLTQKVDLIIMQFLFNDCALGLVHKMKAPFILYNPMGVASYQVSKLGGHFPPSFVPGQILGYPEEMTFLQRLVNFGFHALGSVMIKYNFEYAMAQCYRDKLKDPSLPSVEEISSHASLLLSNSHFASAGKRPYLPNVVDIGGIHSKPAQSLPKVNAASNDKIHLRAKHEYPVHTK